MPSSESKQAKKKKKKRSHSSRASAAVQEPPLPAWHPGGWNLWGSSRFCCTEIRCCPTKERIAEKSHSRRHQGRGEENRHQGEAERRERRRRRREKARKAEEEEGKGSTGPGNSAVPAVGGGVVVASQLPHRTPDDDASSGGRSARSCTSFASSYASGTTGASDATSARSGQCGQQHSGTGVKVMHLADLRGQELPSNLESQLPPAARAVVEQPPPLSARSGGGRSEGGRSTRSFRSEGGQSAGGASVASVSISKYMGYLSESRSPAEVKKMVKDFVRQMVKGREMGVLRADGALKPVLCALTRSLDVFRIKSGTEVRKVKLAEVQRVVHGAPEEFSDLETPLDESCSTMELESDECISFKFAERKGAELFTLCMQLFIDGQRQ